MTRRTFLALAAALAGVTVLRAADPDPFDQSGIPIEQQPTDPKLAKIVLIAGFPTPKLKSGEHEYFAGCALLWKMLRQTPGVFPVVVRDGWPTKAETLAGAKAVVLFLEGGDVHPAVKGDRFARIQKLADAGAGIVHFHSAIDYPKDFGERVRGLAGAHWEKSYSQRAHWVAAFRGPSKTGQRLENLRPHGHGVVEVARLDAVHEDDGYIPWHGPLPAPLARLTPDEMPQCVQEPMRPKRKLSA